MSPTGDLPAMLASNYASNSYSAAEMLGSAASSMLHNQLASQQQLMPSHDWHERAERDARRIIQNIATKEKEPDMPSRRIVQVYIADPHEDVPLDEAVLYTGEQKLTDLTDQELFFEIDMKTILAAHNAVRTKLVNKKVKDRTEYLDPVKIRDLKMVVVTVASF